MQWKTKELAKQYHSKQLCLPLQEVCLMLECLCRLYRDGIKMPDGITITDIWRPGDLKSYHSKWRAVDIRTYDWSLNFKRLVAILLDLLNRSNKKIQHEFEPNDRHPDADAHLHIEYDDGSIHK